ncbi:MAG: hypothetical protein C0504_02765 [Candidatus Solibacter sp.]|nr:hypothetical protein [Candidatus Solibacter sp.]
MQRRHFLSLAAAPLAAAPKPKVVFVCGDHEYSGEFTLPLVAAELEKRYALSCAVLKSVPDQNGETDIPGLDALDSAQLAVFYLRWRRLPASQLAPIERYVKSGRPVMAFRTTSHAFRYPKGDPLEPWNGWAAEAFGAPPGWGADGHTHFGHKSTTGVKVSSIHPTTAGLLSEFKVRSWLYRVAPKWPPPGAQVLLTGTAVNPDKPADPNPVAWAWTNPHGGRALYTSLGHPEDFAVEPFQRFVFQSIQWCLDPKRKPSWKGAVSIQVPYRGMVKTG